jgi:hypothetical protein
MFGQFADWLDRLWFDWLWLDWLCVVELLEDDEPFAALAIAAPPPTPAPTAATVARATQARFCMIDHLLSPCSLTCFQ